MAIVLTYDVDSFHDEIKDSLIQDKGYKKMLHGSGVQTQEAMVVDIPNTTLYHETRDEYEAYDDLYDLAISFGAKVEKLLVVPVDPNKSWVGLGRKAPVPKPRLLTPRKL